jgi:hypothetical protein
MKMHPVMTQLAALALLCAAPATVSSREVAAAGASAAPAASKEGAKKPDAIAEKVAARPTVSDEQKDVEAAQGETWFDAERPLKVAERLSAADDIHHVSQLPRLGPLDEPNAAEVLENSEHTERTVQFQQDLAGAVQRGAPAAGYWSSPQTYQWQILPQGLIYRNYLAGEKESRFGSEWNRTDGHRDIWDVTLGGNVGVLRYGTSDDVRPQGWQLGMEGASQVRLDRGEHLDVDSSDFRFGIPMTWGDSIYQVKFAFYHLSSHIQDE